MTSTVASLFDDAYLQALTQRAQADPFVARQRTLARLRIGFRQTDPERRATIVVSPDDIAASDQGEALFTFVGDEPAMQALASGFPFNRLVRQHRLTVEGDLRTCVQNWLLIHAILRLCAPQDH